MPTYKLLSSFALLSLSALHASANAAPGYFQDPALHKNNLVFTADGDLWLSKLDAQQVATRLTSHPSVETSATISIDGNQLAFVADYTGIPAIFVMPVNGGVSQQVSFENRPVKLHGWVDNQTLLYSTQSDTGMHSSWVLKTLNLETEKIAKLPVSDAVEGVIDEAQNMLYFTQFGLQISTDNAAYYKGGASGEIWKFNTSDGAEAIKLTAAHEGSVRTPMLANERLYFISNQNGLDNIWSMTLDGTDFRQHTAFNDFAVRDAYQHQDTIIFQHGADIKTYTISTDETFNVSVQLLSDFAQLQPKLIENPLDFFNDVNIAPQGDKVAVIARGELAVAFPSDQRLVKIAKPGHARLRSAVISNTGKSVYAVSDQSGEYEIWSYPADGRSGAIQLTTDGDILRLGMWLTPDGKSILNLDKAGRLKLLNIKRKKNRLIMDNLSGGLSGVHFSADSRYIALGITQINEERSRIYLYDTEDETGQFITSNKYASYSPSFSHDGHWLYFLSDRHFNGTPSSPWGDRNMGAQFDKRTQVFAISLSGTQDFPFAPDTEISASDVDEDTGLVWKGINSRLWQVDIEASNYNKLIAAEDHLFVQDEDVLKAIKIENSAKAEKVTDGVVDVQWSNDTKHLMVQKGRSGKSEFFIIPAAAKMPEKLNDHKVKLSNWRLQINPKEEFQQLFQDAWLMHRDSFYDANMRGVDWDASLDKFQPLVERVTERSELNDIFEQMMGELNSLHSQVRGGDIEESERMLGMSTLGAVLEDTDDGVKITRIYAFDKEIIEQAPPLARPGVNASANDIITAINGQSVSTIKDVQFALQNQSGLQTLLALKRGKNKLKTVVVPDNGYREVRLRYQDWVARNVEKVANASNDIGYLHLYAMGSNDLASFAREFYAQYQKPALIIDVRRNRGGNIDSLILDKLLRRVWSFWQQPNGETFTNMQQTFRGHLVVLADEFTYSDGETFTAGIKAMELAPVIGKQTAGAGVWLSGGNRLVDGGIARVAEFPVYSPDGRWITEARGISPDIEVENPPHATFNGEDAQLSTAIEYLREQMKRNPMPDLKAKPFPPVEEAADDITK